MRTTWRRAGAVLLAVGLTFGLLGCDQLVKTLDPGPQPSDTLKIGVIQPSGYFNGFSTGAELARQELNAQGGVLGRQIEFIYRDNQGDDIFPTGEATVRSAQELIVNEGVFALLGVVFSVNAIELAEITAQTETILITNATSAPVSASSEYVFLVAPTTGSQGVELGKFAASAENLGAQTAAILLQADDLYSNILADTFTASFEAQGGTVAARASYAVGSVDFSEPIETVLAANPDVILAASFAPEVPLAIEQGRAAGYEGDIIGGSGWYTPDTFLNALDDNAPLNGSFFTSNYSGGAPSSGVQHFVNLYEAVHGEPPSGKSPKGYDAMTLLAQAIEQAGSLDSPAVRDALAATTDYEGATAIVRFNEDRQPVKAIVLQTIQDGEMRFHQLLTP